VLFEWQSQMEDDEDAADDAAIKDDVLHGS
jgi:hypothetical protein